MNEVVLLLQYPIRFCIIHSETAIYGNVLRLDRTQVHAQHQGAWMLLCELNRPLRCQQISSSATHNTNQSTYNTGAASDIKCIVDVLPYRRKVQQPIGRYAKCMVLKIQSVLLWFIIRKLVKRSFVGLGPCQLAGALQRHDKHGIFGRLRSDIHTPSL
jgi:hypothetical protein